MAQFANNADMAELAAQHDAWFDSVDTSHIQPLSDGWRTHPFWADAEDVQDPDTAAGKVIANMQSEFTPSERAESCKEAGNALLQQGRKIGKRHVIKQASDKYGEGLSILHAAGATYAVPARLRTALYSNRAFAESLIGNWRNALNSARWAIRTDRSHLKSYFRAAQAAQQLKRWSDALEVCKRGLEVEPGAAELLKIQQVEALQACQVAWREEQEREAAAAAARERQLAPLRRVARALMERSIRVTRPQFGFQQTGDTALPWLTDDGVLHFPAMFFYPEATPYHDTIEDCSEHDVIADHLDQMFGPDAPPLPWDSKGEYTRQRLRLYYCSNVGTVLKEAQVVEALQGQYPSNYVELGVQKFGPKASSMRTMDSGWTFADLLKQPDHIMPGIPVLWVVAAGTSFEQDFVQRFDASEA